MKNSIFVFGVICIVGVYSHFQVSDKEKSKIQADVEACAKESGVDRGLLDDISEGKPFTPTRELDCFSACILKKNGIMNEDGTVNEGKPAESEKAKECKKLSGKDACETAGKVMECFVKNQLIPKV